MESRGKVKNFVQDWIGYLGSQIGFISVVTQSKPDPLTGLVFGVSSSSRGQDKNQFIRISDKSKSSWRDRIQGKGTCRVIYKIENGMIQHINVNILINSRESNLQKKQQIFSHFIKSLAEINK